MYMQICYQSFFCRRGWIALGVLLLLLLPGCGSNSSVRVVAERAPKEMLLDNFAQGDQANLVSVTYHKPKYRLLGRLYLDRDDKDSSPPLVIDVHRREHAYMLETPLASNERSRTCFVLGGHKEHRLMTGLQFRWSF